MRRRRHHLRARRGTVVVVFAIGAVLGAFGVGQAVSAQGSVSEALARGADGFGTNREREAWQHVERREFVRARELGEAIVRDNPRSFIGHLVLGHVQHYAEANFPRALYHEEIALARYEERFGSEPTPDMPWRWHSRLLRELGETHGDLEHHAQRIAFIERYNERYRPRRVADMAWSLMKMGRYDEARLAAQQGLALGREDQRVIGLNALCAIEFEAGDIQSSYQACLAALEYARQQGRPAVVDLTNFAEAARSVFALDVAERVLLEATEANVSWYGNPYLELAELYTRSARFNEAAAALKQIPAYRAQRPPHARDADRNEVRRGLTGFLLVAGMHEEALRMTTQAIVAPDRRAHNSRDPALDRSLTALLDRRARLMEAEATREAATAAPFYERWWAWAQASWLRFEAWASGRRAATLLARDARLEGTISFGSSEGAITPPWLAGDLVEVMGAGVMRAAVSDARARDERQAASAYYDALDAETYFVSGDERRGRALAQQARAGIGGGDALLRARLLALVADASDGTGTEHEDVLGVDPGAFRRLGLSVPVRMEHGSGVMAALVADAIARSPRFDVRRDAPMRVRVDVTSAGGRVCLLGGHGRVLGCGEGGVEHDEDDIDTVVGRIVTAFHEGVFAPRVDMSQTDLNSLDGANTSGRGTLQQVIDADAVAP